ncbi:Methyltransferase domain-containing protein [Pseudonocardia thermophila]|jgi:Methylase involved in ubiquinone/menaquinone biosynthesis|uniref:Methyltransferase domain-containing protein n=1 Tax=Pseudonocardia thermophila TaxID=1848 RepID=A0A1M6YSP0_PSETH|nr:methyltransferase domain-containing protein [Pseudonocardia thermophila]SHL21072.1 Methyltransferase domain-containing protein [Pseudonocardia thermophila]
MDRSPPGRSELRHPTVAERVAFALELVEPGARVLDVGCGAGTLTALLVDPAGPEGSVLGVDLTRANLATARERCPAAAFVAGSAYALPVADGVVDLVFAHALMEHLARPDRALVEFRRVLRPGGRVALSSSDWGGARVLPRDRDVHRALSAYVGLRRRSGGDPCAGGRLAWWARQAGLTEIQVRTRHRVDVSYADLARHVGACLQHAAAHATAAGDRAELFAAAQAAARWSAHGRGTGRVEQCWVEVTARSAGAGA